MSKLNKAQEKRFDEMMKSRPVTPYRIKYFIADALTRQKKEIIEKIKRASLVVPCKPDCTPEQHSYHEGTWAAQVRIEELIETIKNDK